MPRPRWPKHVENNLKKRAWECHHCKKKLNLEDRKSWHIDHFPIPYRDIEDQCCCGITDPFDETNLVVSCPQCNMSHKFEAEGRWCGRTQFPCLQTVFHKVKIFALGTFVGFLSGAVTMQQLK